jgi:hypothetical protein
MTWQAQLRRGRGQPHVPKPRSTRPRRLRRREWPQTLIQEIRRLRSEHPNLGKEKLHPAIKRFCAKQALAVPSVRTIGRLIADAPDKMRHAKLRVSRFHQGRCSGITVSASPRAIGLSARATASLGTASSGAATG